MSLPLQMEVIVRCVMAGSVLIKHVDSCVGLGETYRPCRGLFGAPEKSQQSCCERCHMVETWIIFCFKMMEAFCLLKSHSKPRRYLQTDADASSPWLGAQSDLAVLEQERKGDLLRVVLLGCAASNPLHPICAFNRICNLTAVVGRISSYAKKSHDGSQRKSPACTIVREVR